MPNGKAKAWCKQIICENSLRKKARWREKKNRMKVLTREAVQLYHRTADPEFVRAIIIFFPLHSIISLGTWCIIWMFRIYNVTSTYRLRIEPQTQEDATEDEDEKKLLNIFCSAFFYFYLAMILKHRIGLRSIRVCYNFWDHFHIATDVLDSL